MDTTVVIATQAATPTLTGGVRAGTGWRVRRAPGYLTPLLERTSVEPMPVAGSPVATLPSRRARSTGLSTFTGMVTLDIGRQILK